MAKKSTVIDAFVDKFSGASFRLGDTFDGTEERVAELVELGYLSEEVTEVATEESEEATEKKNSRKRG